MVYLVLFLWLTIVSSATDAFDEFDEAMDDEEDEVLDTAPKKQPEYDEDEFESLKKIVRKLTNKKGQLVIHD